MKTRFMFAMVATVLVGAPFAVCAQEYTRGYTRSDGTEVRGYMHSTPDGDATNNYSYRGNTNPYTGEVGSHTEQDSGSWRSRSDSYGSEREGRSEEREQNWSPDPLVPTHRSNEPW